MSFLTVRKTVTHLCSQCGKPTLHEKTGASYDYQLPLLFITLLLWTPILVLTILWDRATPYRCTICGSKTRTDQIRTADVKDEPPEGPQDRVPHA